LASLANRFVLLGPYQSIIQTVLTGDAIRLGIEADAYDSTRVTVAYRVGVIHGVFAGLSLSARIGMRYTLILGMPVFSLGNILCGALGELVGQAIALFVGGFGKMIAMAICRVSLYKQFDHLLLVENCDEAVGEQRKGPRGDRRDGMRGALMFRTGRSRLRRMASGEQRVRAVRPCEDRLAEGRAVADPARVARCDHARLFRQAGPLARLGVGGRGEEAPQ
jgi:hypothetical protein